MHEHDIHLLLAAVANLESKATEIQEAIKKSQSFPANDLGHWFWLDIAADKIEEFREALEELGQTLAKQAA